MDDLGEVLQGRASAWLPVELGGGFGHLGGPLARLCWGEEGWEPCPEVGGELRGSGAGKL